MLRAALVGLVAFAVSSGWLGWLVYRADVAAQRLRACRAGVLVPANLITRSLNPVVRRLAPNWVTAYMNFRAEIVYFNFNGEPREPIPAEAFDELRHLPFLKTVRLRYCVFNPHHLDRLAAARQIQELDLHGLNRRISDDALDAILKLRNLHWLHLSQSCISDDGVARLAELEHLTFLDLSYCHCVSQEAVDRLAEKLPDCTIKYVPPKAIHRYTCPACGYAVNRGEWMNELRHCPKCFGKEPLLVQRNFDICHPVIEHHVPVRKPAR